MSLEVLERLEAAFVPLDSVEGQRILWNTEADAQRGLPKIRMTDDQQTALQSTLKKGRQQCA
jgi:hypothetical protein